MVSSEAAGDANTAVYPLGYIEECWRAENEAEWG